MISESVLVGERLRLRPPAERDLPLFVRWFSDPEVSYWLSMSEGREVTLESERGWYHEMRADAAQVVWCIETEEGRPIGNLGLHSIDETHGRATLGIVIGEKTFWGRDYGTEAIRQVLRYVFTALGLRRIALDADEDNARGIRFYEKCGFVREGLLRAHRLRRGQPVNVVAMSVLREDWEAQPWR